jgi:hypothetical protein
VEEDRILLEERCTGDMPHAELARTGIELHQRRALHAQQLSRLLQAARQHLVEILLHRDPPRQLVETLALGEAGLEVLGEPRVGDRHRRLAGQRGEERRVLVREASRAGEYVDVEAADHRSLALERGTKQRHDPLVLHRRRARGSRCLTRTRCRKPKKF